MHGTVFNVAAPAFLQLSSRQEEESENDEAFADDLEADDEFVDEDLEVLVEGEAATEVVAEAADDMVDAGPRKGGKTLTDDEESGDREIEIDLSQFEDALDLEGMPGETEKVQQEQEVQSLSLKVPAELGDLSDLAPPSRGMQAEKSEAKAPAEKAAAGADMDDMDFDLGLGDLEANFTTGSDPAKETILALDDIDFSETLTKTRANPSERQSGAGMDDDLNFDLDLGGLSIHKDL